MKRCGTYFVAAVVGLLTTMSASARAQSYIPFTNYLPPLTTDPTEYESGYNDYCRDDGGQLNTYGCVDKVIREMSARYDRYHRTCDHRGIFSLVYLVTTQEYQRASLEPGFFDDPEFLNHYDTVFAQFYFHASDAWTRGDLTHVPPVWQVAFSSAQGRTVTTLGDMMLGMAAHILRDLPIVIATIGLTDPETGLSRKPDHDAVNAFLARVVVDPAIQAAWDPSFSTSVPGSPVSPNAAVTAIIQAWREAAWRWAELLISAPTPETQADVIMQIEWYAYTQALAFQASTSYLRPLQSSVQRDLFCTNHR